jgi:hypothetical protein
MIVICAAVLAVLGGTAVYAQDKYAVKSPIGIAFSDFKGCEDWAVVSSDFNPTGDPRIGPEKADV